MKDWKNDLQTYWERAKEEDKATALEMEADSLLEKYMDRKQKKKDDLNVGNR